MGYDINYYSDDKARKRDLYFSAKPLFFDDGIDTNKIFFDYILDSIKRIRAADKENAIKILDLGTGTGYVPQILCQLSDENFAVTGIDLSEKMIDLAKYKIKDNRVDFFIGNNGALPFEDNSIDLVTNKLTTQFDINEVNRILKPGGYFVFKEYGEFKGFKEISEIFKGRYVKVGRTPAGYYNELQGLGFREIILRKFLIKREYDLAEIKKIFEMANIVENFTEDDLSLIEGSLGQKLLVTSDPFILYAQK